MGKFVNKLVNTTLEKALRKEGCTVRPLWEIAVPEDTLSAFHHLSLLSVIKPDGKHEMVIVASMGDDGYQSFIFMPNMRIDADVDQIMGRLRP